MRHKHCAYALFAALLISGCDNTTQPADQQAVSFAVEVDSTLMPGLYRLHVKFASQPDLNHICLKYVRNGTTSTTGSCPGGAHGSDILLGLNSGPNTLSIGLPRPIAGPESVTFTAIQLKSDSGVEFQVDTTFLAPPQPRVAGLKVVPAAIADYIELLAYSARNNSVVVAYRGGGTALLNLDDESFRQVYAVGSGVHVSAITPDGDSIISVSGLGYPGPPITLSILPMRSVGAGRKTVYPGAAQLGLSGVYVTSNGKAFVPLTTFNQTSVPGVILEYDFKTDRWRERTDAGTFKFGPFVGASGNGARLVALGGSNEQECCVTYDAAADTFKRVNAGTLPSIFIGFSPRVQLNFDGSLMIAGLIAYDQNFQPKGNFTTWSQSGLDPSSYLAPEDYVLFRAHNGVVLGDPLTGRVVGSWNVGYGPFPFGYAPSMYVAPDPHRTFIAPDSNGFAFLRLRN